MDVTATIKWWQQAQRYHWFDFVSSCSTIHRLPKFDLDKAYSDYTDEVIVERMKELQRQYNDNPSHENYMRLIYSNPVGMELTARMTTNYLQLKTMYKQRNMHPLKEWRDFCEWIGTLLYTKELGVCESRNMRGNIK